jgi:hypothetical protein
MYGTLRPSTRFEQHAAHPQEDQLYHHSLWYGDTIGLPEDEQRAAGNMLRSVV